MKNLNCNYGYIDLIKHFINLHNQNLTKMKKNLGSTDKIVRYLIALIAVVLVYTETLTGWLSYVALAVGVVMLITALINFCPLYAVFGIKTCKI